MILAVAQVVAGAVHELLGWGRSISERSAALDTPITPAGYAFSIWGLIYAGCLALAAYQALGSQQGRLEIQRMRPWLAAALLTNTIWPLYVQAVTLDVVSVILIFSTLAFLLMAWFRWETTAGAEKKTAKDLWLIRYPLSLFAGWVSAASFVNLAATSKYYGLTSGSSEAILACVLLVCCAALVLAVCRALSSTNLYATAILWALVAIIVSSPSQWVVATAALTGLGVLYVAGVGDVVSRA